MTAPRSPSGSSVEVTTEVPVRMSAGASSATIACPRRAGDSSSSNALASSSSSGRGRTTGAPPYQIPAGWAPRNSGATSTRPPLTVAVTDTWWPSKRQLHSASPGVPKIARW